MTRVSVAMCTYNGEKYLHEQLQSIAAQTRLPDEMVVCDDGSSDATAEIIEEFARIASFPVRFFRNPKNLGSTKNFEKAIGLCTGDLIALSDQDDIWLPGKLARQAEMMERDPSLGAVFCDAELIDATSRPIGIRLWPSILFPPREQKRFRSGRGIDVLLKRNVVTGATLMVRANLRYLFIPVPAIWVHDGWIAWMMVVYTKLAFISEPLLRYRLHAGQQIGTEIAALSGLSLLQRLRKGKRDEPAKHLATARELEELRRHLLCSNAPGSHATALLLQQKIAFLRDRAAPNVNRIAKVFQLFLHAGHYQRYESGLKFFVRDILMVFV